MSNQMPFINLGNYAMNFMSSIKNYSQDILYGLTSNGSPFNLLPSTIPGYNFGGICAESYVIQDPTGKIDTLANKTYKLPVPNAPVYIEEHNVLLFSSAEERAKTIEAYGGNGANLVKSYAANMVSLLNASFKAITCLNVDKDFYMMTPNGIAKIPTITEEYRDECLRKYKLDPAILEIKDVFLINTVIKNTSKEHRNNENIVNTTVKQVEKDKLIKDEPLIFENDGLVIFDGEKQAQAFVAKHGTVANYMVHRALEATHRIHDEEISDINEQVSKDKRGMFETFGLMGGTSIVSILTENVIRSYNSGENSEEAVKKAFKILGIGLLGIISVGGLYKLYRYLSDKRKKEAKQQR